MRMEPAHGVIEIGNILWGPAIARTRVATEAFFLAARHAFDELGYRRFEWKCNDRNEPSKAAAARFGFTFEGVFRQHMVVKGVNRDTAWFSIIDREWPQIRAAFERWLDPSNFDAAGRQKAQLAARRPGSARLATALNIFRGDTLPGPGISLLFLAYPGVARARSLLMVVLRTVRTRRAQRKFGLDFIAIIAAVMLAAMPAATVAQEATKAEPAKAEPSKAQEVKQDIKDGARKAGHEVKETARDAGHEVKHAAKETKSGVKRGWHEFKEGAADFGRGVKNFFSGLFRG